MLWDKLFQLLNSTPYSITSDKQYCTEPRQAYPMGRPARVRAVAVCSQARYKVSAGRVAGWLGGWVSAA